LIMMHSDDNGLVVPPKLAPLQVAIVPIHKGEEELKTLREKIEPVVKELRAKGITVKFDDDDKQRPGWKFAEYEMRGIPVRLAMGMRDLQNGSIELARRDTLSKESVSFEGIADRVANLLEEIQQSMYEKALKFRDGMTSRVSTYTEFKEVLEKKGGFIYAHWDGTAETEEKIKEETKATIRCIPLNNKLEAGTCIYSGKPSKQEVIFARAY